MKKNCSFGEIVHKKTLSNRLGLRHHKPKDGFPTVSELKKSQGPFSCNKNGNKV
jgi:hypothetical protein